MLRALIISVFAGLCVAYLIDWIGKINYLSLRRPLDEKTSSDHATPPTSPEPARPQSRTTVVVSKTGEPPAVCMDLGTSQFRCGSCESGTVFAVEGSQCWNCGARVEKVTV